MVDSVTLLKKAALRMLPARMIFHLKKFHYSRTVPSFWEPDVEPLKYLVRPGDLVIDVGAHVGWYSHICSSLVGDSGMVCSIEPIPETFHILSTIIKNLGLRNVLLLNCAISESDGDAAMGVPLNESGIENLYQARIVESEQSALHSRRCNVQLRSIDSLLISLPKLPSFIKCDTEGHELSVIKGASETIWKCRPSWLIEVTGDPDDRTSSANKIFGLLRERDYEGYWFDGQSLRARSVGDNAINYFFLQPCHVAQMESAGMQVKHYVNGPYDLNARKGV